MISIGTTVAGISVLALVLALVLFIFVKSSSAVTFVGAFLRMGVVARSLLIFFSATVFDVAVNSVPFVAVGTSLRI